MHLQLPPSIEARLRQEAAAAGVDLESFVVHVLSDSVAGPSATGASPSLASTADRLAYFRAFAARHPVRTQLADASRETIYAERGR